MLLDYLRSNRYTSATAYAEYLKKESNKLALHVFIEGKDDPSFYSKFLITARPKDPVEFYICGNKDGVYLAYDKVNAKPSGKNILFFVDSDLDHALSVQPKSGIFHTKYYSIESYIVKYTNPRHILCSINGLPHQCTVLIEDICKSLADNTDKFIADMRIVMAVIIVLRQKYGDKMIKLSDVNINKFFTQCGTSISLRRKEFILEICRLNGKPIPGFMELAIAMRLLCRPLDSFCWIRGKWALSFFVKCIESIPPQFIPMDIRGYANRVNCSNLVPMSISVLNIPEIDNYISVSINECA